MMLSGINSSVSWLIVNTLSIDPWDLRNPREEKVGIILKGSVKFLACTFGHWVSSGVYYIEPSFTVGFYSASTAEG